MGNQSQITAIRFKHYKAFENYSLTLRQFNILVGPNNCGKSTVVGAFRILAEGIRKARSRNPVFVEGPSGETRGYQVDLKDIPVATENVFHNYDDTRSAQVLFEISNGNSLLLHFPEPGRCHLICNTNDRPITSTSAFRSQFNLTIASVPILGPVEHDEQLYKEEAARLALLTHRAARNFRNIWHHYPEGFSKFRNLVNSTWPGMDIERPEVDSSHPKPLLRMFCPERRIPREIYWAGFGFQVWCQMLTYIIRAKDASVFLIDEPDIYLHADLQRQLLGILKTLGPDVLIATHSTEIISEADPGDLVIIDKKLSKAKRIKDPTQLQSVFHVLGSNLNPILTQLAKTKRALFVEGKDFQIISRFARKLNRNQVAIRAQFAVVPTEGFNPTKVRDLIEGMETTLGSKVLSAVILDRDYRSDAECKKELRELSKHTVLSRIHKRKEIENFLLVAKPIRTAIERKIAEARRRGSDPVDFLQDVEELLVSLTETMRYRVQAQYMARRRQFEKSMNRGIDDSTIEAQLMSEFDRDWANWKTRSVLVPGKEVISALNAFLQREHGIAISGAFIIESFRREDVMDEMVELIDAIDDFRRMEVPSE